MVSLNLIAVIAIAGFVAALTVGVLYYNQIIHPNEQKQQQGNGNNGADNTSNNSIKLPQNNASSIIAISSPYAKEFTFPKDVWPNSILVDKKGMVWTVGSKSHSLEAFDPATEKIKSYPIPNSDTTVGMALVWTMVEGNNSSIWFSGSGGIPLWRFDPSTEKFEAVTSVSASPIQMKVDVGGRIWYTTLYSGKLGVVQKEGQSYLSKEIQLENDSFPSGLQVRNDSVWITQAAIGKITVFNVTYDDSNGMVANISKSAQYPTGESRLFSPTDKNTLFSPTDIVLHNGSAWVTEHGTAFVTQYDTKSNTITRYPTALHPIHVSTLPYWLASDVNHEGVWFNEHRGNRMAFLNFSGPTLTEYEVPTRDPAMAYLANALTISSDPNDESKLWFTELTTNKIGVVDRKVPIPFDVSSLQQHIILEKGGTATIKIDISKVKGAESSIVNHTLSFGVSGTEVFSGKLMNVTTDFSPEKIDLGKLNDTQSVTLSLKDDWIQSGQYVLAVSANDGAVIRTVYMELEVR